MYVSRVGFAFVSPGDEVAGLDDEDWMDECNWGRGWGGGGDDGRGGVHSSIDGPYHCHLHVLSPPLCHFHLHHYNNILPCPIFLWEGQFLLCRIRYVSSLPLLLCTMVPIILQPPSPPSKIFNQTTFDQLLLFIHVIVFIHFSSCDLCLSICVLNCSHHALSLSLSLLVGLHKF